MASLLNALILVGPPALLAGLLAALILYVRARSTAGSFLAYAWRVLLAGIAAFVVGTAIGIGIFCAPDNAGNLCGLGGVLGLGPLGAGLTIGVYAHRLAKGARAAP